MQYGSLVQHSSLMQHGSLIQHGSRGTGFESNRTGSNGLYLSPGQGHHVVLLGKTLYSHSASLHPGV